MIDNSDSINLTSLKTNQSETSIGSDTSNTSNGSTEPLIGRLKSWTERKNSLLLLIVSFTLILSPLSNTTFFPAIVDIREYFQITDLSVNALSATSTFFSGFAPLFWGSYSDTFGKRRTTYLIAITISALSSIICFVSPNIWLLGFARTFQVCGAAAIQCLGAGVISDIYESNERGRAYGIYFLAYNFGEIGGPIIGGYLTEYFGWRYIFLFLSIFSVILFVIIFFFLPETFHYQLTDFSLPSQGEKSITRFSPLSSFKLLRYPNVLLLIIYISSVWSMTSANYIVIPYVYSSQYKLSSSVVGLIFLAPGIGFMLGSTIGGKYSDHVISKFNDNEVYPEIRLKSVWFACILIPISFLAYGWLLYMNSKLYWSLISMFTGSFATLFTVGVLLTYLVDSYQNHSASVIALSECVPAIVGCLFQLSLSPLQNSLGVGWLFTLLISINSVCIPLIVIVYLKGNSWRLKTTIDNLI